MSNTELPEPKENHATKVSPCEVHLVQPTSMLTLESTIYVRLSEKGWDALREYWVDHTVKDVTSRDAALEQFDMFRKKNTHEIIIGGWAYMMTSLTIAQFMAVFGKFTDDIAVTQHGYFIFAPDEIKSAEVYIDEIPEFPLDLGRHAAKVRDEELSLRAGLPDDTCEARKLPKEAPMISADALLAKQKQLAETAEAEANSKVYDEVLPILYSDVTQYAMSHLTAREIKYDIRHGQVLHHEGTGDSVMFTLELMSRVCDALGKYGYDANCSYDKSECNGTFTIKWGVKK